MTWYIFWPGLILKSSGFLVDFEPVYHTFSTCNIGYYSCRFVFFFDKTVASLCCVTSESFTASLLPSVSLSVLICNFLQEARTLPDHFFRFDLNKHNYVKFGNPEMYFSFWQKIFSFARRRKLHLWATKILQNFVSLKRTGLAGLRTPCCGSC